MQKPEASTSTPWKPSDLEPLYRVLPVDSPLRAGVPMLDRVLFAFSNTELKSAFLLYGLDSTPAFMSVIDEKVRKVLPLSWSQTPQPYNAVRLLRNFICPTNFAEEPAKHYFATTSEGEGIAKDSAAFLLSKALDLGFPFGPVLRERSEQGQNPTRAYITRLAILFALSTGKAISHVDLNTRMGGTIYDSLSWNMAALSKRKLILYEASLLQEGQSIYERKDLSVVPKNEKLRIQNLVKYFELNARGNPYTLAKMTGKSMNYMRKLLNTLADMGAIRAVNDAQITPLGLHFLGEVIEPMLAAYSGDRRSMYLLRKARAATTQDSFLVAQALDQYKEEQLITPEEETRDRILDFVKREGPIRRYHILEAVGNIAHPQLIELERNGALIKKREGAASYYLLPESFDDLPSPEVPEIEFIPPADLFNPLYHKRHEYRADLDTVQFWRDLQKELLRLKPEQLTPRQFFMLYDPNKVGSVERGINSGIYANHMRAFLNLGIKRPWEFLRKYNPENAPVDLKRTILMVQAVMDRIIPLDPAPKFGKYDKDLITADFWLKLAEDVTHVSAGTAVETFLRRFDPAYERNMGPGHHHGRYYNLRSACRRFGKVEAAVFLLDYRPPAGSPVNVVLAVRTAQKTIREHLQIRGVKPDDFSDIPVLIQKRKERAQKMFALKTFFQEYGQFDDVESAELRNITIDQVRAWLSNIKGSDVDNASFAAIGFRIRENPGKLTYKGLPLELRSAFLIYAFEQQRKGAGMPLLPTDDDGFYVFKNVEIKKVMYVLEFYLGHYQQEARKKNPNATLSAFSLINFLKKHIDAT